MLFSSVEKLGNSYEKEPPVFCHLAGMKRFCLHGVRGRCGWFFFW